jgi:NADH-quinone oxidoreductase subunit N
MSAPLIWLVFPLGAAGLLLLVGSTRTAARWGAGLALLLALLAWQVPIGKPLPLGGGWGFRLAPQMHILGRQLVLGDAMRPLLVWFFLGVAVWLGGAWRARMEPSFVGLALGVSTILLMALAVRPFLYAALLVETAALLAVPLLSPPGSRAGSGVLRYLTFQTLGMLFILLTGWMLVGTETSLPGSALALRAGVLLGVGFALLLGVFPFHSWMPMLTAEIHPYASAFVLTAVTTVIGAFGLGFLERYTWLRQSPLTYDWLTALGMVMVALGGLLAAFQHHAGRALGYGVLVEIGLGLWAVGLGNAAGIALFFALWPARAVLFGLWAFGLSGLGRRRGGLAYRNLAGLGREFPWLTAAAVFSPLAVAGVPWVVGFSARWALWQSALVSWQALAGMLIGTVGLAAAAARLLGALTMNEETAPWRSLEMADERFWTLALLVLAFGLGLFSQGVWRHAQTMLAWLPHLQR